MRFGGGGVVYYLPFPLVLNQTIIVVLSSVPAAKCIFEY